MQRDARDTRPDTRDLVSKILEILEIPDIACNPVEARLASNMTDVKSSKSLLKSRLHKY